MIANFVGNFAEATGGEGYELARVPDTKGGFKVEPTKTKVIMYADDITGVDATKEGLERTTQALATALALLNIRLSPKKCVYMWSTKSHAAELEPPTMDGCALGREEESTAKKTKRSPANAGHTDKDYTVKSYDRESETYVVTDRNGNNAKRFTFTDLMDRLLPT
jgi:hypothetical protein